MTFSQFRNAIIAVAITMGLGGQAAAQANVTFFPTQYIAALADPEAKSGTGAETWGIWTVDPGPRGVFLREFKTGIAANGATDAGWTFDKGDWWLEEYGRIMEAPTFPLEPGQYVVTGNRAAVSILTVYPPDAEGHMAWDLDKDATIHDVTHLGCRSARYTPAEGQTCTPANASPQSFPVTPGAEMPPVIGCNKQDYAVLLVVGKSVKP
ncbi:MAG TPA: hypothetical protein VLA27_10755 [Paracoccaceae bacterium]|nr:hypothetical protein [Paracoccaceae bacterium]